MCRPRPPLHPDPEIAWIDIGAWSFQVTATDSAGNSAVSPLEYSWAVSFAEGLPYARYLAAPFGMTGKSKSDFSTQVTFRNKLSITTGVSSSPYSRHFRLSRDACCATWRAAAWDESDTLIYTRWYRAWTACQEFLRVNPCSARSSKAKIPQQPITTWLQCQQPLLLPLQLPGLLAAQDCHLRL